MARLENEIVKFIAEIELDPQKAAEATQNLEAVEKRCDSLRQSISQNIRKMDELRAKNQTNSKEYQHLQKEVKQLTEDLKEATKEADKHAATLSINQMSYNQLQKHAKSLRAAINSMHKDANPKAWNSYNKELRQTLNRMTELRNGSQSFGDKMTAGFKKALPSITVAGAALAVVNGVIKAGKAFFNEMTNATQVWGDRWQRQGLQRRLVPVRARPHPGPRHQHRQYQGGGGRRP